MRNKNLNYYNNYNELPENVIEMSFHNWTDPGFFSTENNDPTVLNQTTYIINGKPYSGNTTLAEIGLALSNNEGNNPIVPVVPVDTPRRSKKVHRSSKRRRKQRKTPKKTEPVSNNRFGFKKALSTLTRSLKKITGRTRKNNRN